MATKLKKEMNCFLKGNKALQSIFWDDLSYRHEDIAGIQYYPANEDYQGLHCLQQVYHLDHALLQTKETKRYNLCYEKGLEFTLSSFEDVAVKHVKLNYKQQIDQLAKRTKELQIFWDSNPGEFKKNAEYVRGILAHLITSLFISQESKKVLESIWMALIKEVLQESGEITITRDLAICLSLGKDLANELSLFSFLEKNSLKRKI